MRRLCGFAALTITILPLSMATTAQAATPPAATGATYVVKNGDYLVGIAGKLKVKVADLLAANNLTLTSVILPGQQLAVPAGGVLPAASAGAATPAAPAATAAAATYVVKNGDFLFGIASRMGVKPAQLLAANKLEITSVIVPGQKLVVPEGGVVPADVATSTAATPAAASASAPATTVAPAAPAPSTKVDAVVAYAQAQVGKGYKFFSAGPETFDCSGLVTAAFKQIGITLPQYSGLQATYGTAVDWTTEPIQPGDLVFTARSGSDPTVISHVGIAVSSTKWVQAASSSIGVVGGWIPSDSRILEVRRLIS